MARPLFSDDPGPNTLRWGWFLWVTWAVVGTGLLGEDREGSGFALGLVLSAPFWALWLLWPLLPWLGDLDAPPRSGNALEHPEVGGRDYCSVTITGAWSLGCSRRRGSTSIVHAVQRAASAFDSRMWSIRSPILRRNASIR